jgi:hypothetical protein
MESQREAELIREIETLRLELAACQARDADRDSFRAMYEESPIPTYTWRKEDDDLVLVENNSAADTITQGKISEYLGIRASELYQDRPDIREDLSRCLTEQNLFEREIVYQFTSTGATKYLAVKYTFVPPGHSKHAAQQNIRVGPRHHCYHGQYWKNQNVPRA